MSRVVKITLKCYMNSYNIQVFIKYCSSLTQMMIIKIFFNSMMNRITNNKEKCKITLSAKMATAKY